MKLNANMMINEKLDFIAEGETLEEQVTRAKQVATIDSTFAQFMRMAVIKEERLAGLPEGMPDTYKAETTLPDGVSNTTARQEFRRIRNFQANGPMQKIPTHKREMSWLQMLEGMHWKEANVLVHIKDQTLLTVYPNMFEVLTTLGAQINIEEVPSKIKKKKPKKT
jgi:hypothetical protein